MVLTRTIRYCQRVPRKSIWRQYPVGKEWAGENPLRRPWVGARSPKDPASVQRIEHEAFPGWEFGMYFDPDGNVIGVSIDKASEEAPPLTARTVRQFPFGEIRTRGWTALQRAVTSRMRHPSVEGHEAEWEGAFKSRTGRRGRSDYEYALVAADYVKAIPSGRPIQELARDTPYSTVRLAQIIQEARRRELLTPTARGKAGGELTDKAKQLLKGKGDGISR